MSTGKIWYHKVDYDEMKMEDAEFCSAVYFPHCSKAKHVSIHSRWKVKWQDFNFLLLTCPFGSRI